MLPTDETQPQHADVLFGPTIWFANVGYRNIGTMKELEREILLGFWKVHILHHAGEELLHGQWMLTELRRHGYEISPGTLYPLLKRLERFGWLKGKTNPRRGPRAQGLLPHCARAKAAWSDTRAIGGALSRPHCRNGKNFLNDQRRV
jgi:hypothetical protein